MVAFWKIGRLRLFRLVGDGARHCSIAWNPPAGMGCGHTANGGKHSSLNKLSTIHVLSSIPYVPVSNESPGCNRSFHFGICYGRTIPQSVRRCGRRCIGNARQVAHLSHNCFDDIGALRGCGLWQTRLMPRNFFPSGGSLSMTASGEPRLRILAGEFDSRCSFVCAALHGRPAEERRP